MQKITQTYRANNISTFKVYIIKYTKPDIFIKNKY